MCEDIQSANYAKPCRLMLLKMDRPASKLLGSKPLYQINPALSAGGGIETAGRGLERRPRHR